MSEPFIAEIRIFAGDFAPRGWAFCDGQVVPIAQNTTLFSLIGNIYGGDGRVTTALPNMQGRAPMHPGRGPGLTERFLGEMTGTEEVTITQATMPAHTHLAHAATTPPNTNAPSVTAAFSRSQGGLVYEPNAGSDVVDMAPQSLSPAGGNLPHENVQPLLALNFIIALLGIYPSRA
ncbi:microcystin-dependent protein [Hoeflea marina]|uniref:Microcystin-dependent protein n=1 Tax=Hoeflea marina TaxID=274592 RepID=A0A317PJV3_9HYPH|nr:tail fiber protein [Hoeflea marina]PWV98849.1 microcystin-dependent protein [Hoeflea marina]